MRTMAHDIGAELDYVLAGRTVERQALDWAILGEAVLEAQTRHTELVDGIEAREADLQRKLNVFEEHETVRAFYDNLPGKPVNDPDFLKLQDHRLLRGFRGALIDLRHTASAEFAGEPFAQLAHRQPNLAASLRTLANSERLPKQALDRLAAGTLCFKARLDDIRFISHDKVLFGPLLWLGNDLIEAYAASAHLRRTFSVTQMHNGWARELTELIGKVNLVGENGEVMDDTVEYLFSWTQRSVANGILNGSFYLPTNQTYEQFEKQLYEEGPVLTTSYGDEDFFAYAKRLRAEKEANK